MTKTKTKQRMTHWTPSVSKISIGYGILNDCSLKSMHMIKNNYAIVFQLKRGTFWHIFVMI